MITHDRTTVTCAALLVTLASLPLDAAHAKDKQKKKRIEPMASTTGSEGQRITLDGIREPSGIAVRAGLRHLFVVGDEGTLGELDERGRTIRVDTVAGNLEDLAFHPPSGTLLLLAENQASLIVYDPVAHQEKRRIALDAASLLMSRAPSGVKGRGFEGLAFRPEAGHPGGGVFYLAHQRSPAMVVAVAFDPLQASTLANDAVVDRWRVEPYQHLTAISYDASSDRFLMIADRRLVVLGTDGKTEAQSEPLQMLQPEGVCVDAGGALWIADDPTGLVRYPGGFKALVSGAPAGPTRNR